MGTTNEKSGSRNIDSGGFRERLQRIGLAFLVWTYQFAAQKVWRRPHSSTWLPNTWVWGRIHHWYFLGFEWRSSYSQRMLQRL